MNLFITEKNCQHITDCIYISKVARHSGSHLFYPELFSPRYPALSSHVHAHIFKSSVLSRRRTFTVNTQPRSDLQTATTYIYLYILYIHIYNLIYPFKIEPLKAPPPPEALSYFTNW